MTLDASPDEPKEGEQRELTLEGRERFRPLLASLRGISIPKFDFKIPSIVDTTRRSRGNVAADVSSQISFVGTQRRVTGGV